jgi:hypothetical protein
MRDALPSISSAFSRNHIAMTTNYSKQETRQEIELQAWKATVEEIEEILNGLPDGADCVAEAIARGCPLLNYDDMFEKNDEEASQADRG